MRPKGKFFTTLLLVALLFRAYVPAGFMPASGTPFLLEICPAAYQAQMPAHHGHQHSETHSHFENCPFGGTPVAGPISHIVAFEPPAHLVSQPAAFEASYFSARQPRAHQPRGPPSLA